MGLDGLADRPTMADLRDVVADFLRESLPEVRTVNVVKMTPIDPGEGTWEAEAELWRPNPTIQSLQIQMHRPVLDKQLYLVRLDDRLNVTAYGLKQSVSPE